MINILSYAGMSLQSEVCLWTLLGILRTIFDATLFKVNANLKQVWSMKMPDELSVSVQRVLRTMISGVMLVQCFTVYVYLASYIVLLYPVFLEERPTLVLPWLLLAAVRNFLCELTSLALGLGTCVLLGPARPPCIKFLILKLSSIMPAFYMWMLIFSYYHYLKMASAFKTFPAVLPSKNLDYGLELAVRRRRTKSLQGEDQLRKRLIANFYGDQAAEESTTKSIVKIGETLRKPSNLNTFNNEDISSDINDLGPLHINPNRTISDIGTYEEWFDSELVLPRDTDRILEQFVLMLLRIGVYKKKENVDPAKLMSNSHAFLSSRSRIDCPTISTEETETPPLVGSSKGGTASYLRDYPQIFMKKASDLFPLNNPEPIKQNSTREGSCQSSHSIESGNKSISDTVSPIKNIKSNYLKEKEDDTLIHSQENIEKYIDNEGKHVENISSRTINLTPNSKSEVTEETMEVKESVESIINRMKNRAAHNDISSDDEKENKTRTDILNRIKNHAKNKNTSDTKNAASDLSRKSGKSSKATSSKSTNTKKKSQ